MSDKMRGLEMRFKVVYYHRQIQVFPSYGLSNHSTGDGPTIRQWNEVDNYASPSRLLA